MIFSLCKSQEYVSSINYKNLDEVHAESFIDWMFLGSSLCLHSVRRAEYSCNHKGISTVLIILKQKFTKESLL